MSDAYENKSNCICVIGDIMLDEYLKGECTRISPEAPVPVFKYLSEEYRAGGAGNVAVNISALGVNTIISGILGYDHAGEKLERLFENHNIVNRSVKSKKINTTIKRRIVTGGQQLLRIDIEDAKCKVSKISQETIMSVVPKIIEFARVLILSDYAKGYISDPLKIIELANQNKVQVLVDPKGRSFEKYSGAYLLTPNLSEFISVVGPVNSTEEIVRKARECIVQYDFNALVVTRGDEGVTLVTRENEFSYHSEAKEVYDVTGAGDTFISILAYCMSEDIALQTAVKIANKAASIVVSKSGTSALNKSEIESVLNSIAF